MCSRIINNIKSIYDIYFYKIIKFYYPIVEKIVFTNKKRVKKLSKYNICKTYTNCEYIYKFQNVEYNENIYYNLGLIYHTSDQNLNIIIDKELIMFDEDVDSIKIVLLSSTTNTEYTFIDEKFINSILNFTTKKSRLEPLLYYYLQKYLLNNDQIVSVDFEINNRYIRINHHNVLEDIVGLVETNL